jgi:hypothetical protein
MVVMDGTLALIKPDAMHRHDDSVEVLVKKQMGKVRIFYYKKLFVF